MHCLTRTPDPDELGYVVKRASVETPDGMRILHYADGQWVWDDAGVGFPTLDAALTAVALSTAYDRTYIPTWEELGAERFGDYWIAWHNDDGTSADYYMARPRIHFYDDSKPNPKIVAHLDCEDEPDARWTVAVLHALAAGCPVGES